MRHALSAIRTIGLSLGSLLISQTITSADDYSTRTWNAVTSATLQEQQVDGTKPRRQLKLNLMIRSTGGRGHNQAYVLRGVDLSGFAMPDLEGVVPGAEYFINQPTLFNELEQVVRLHHTWTDYPGQRLRTAILEIEPMNEGGWKAFDPANNQDLAQAQDFKFRLTYRTDPNAEPRPIGDFVQIAPRTEPIAHDPTLDLYRYIPQSGLDWHPPKHKHDPKPGGTCLQFLGGLFFGPPCPPWGC